MLNLNLFRNIGFPLYLFIYLILPYSAITQTLKVDFIRNLETSLNKRDLDFIKKNFRNDENQNIPKQFSKVINDFPNSKWKIKSCLLYTSPSPRDMRRSRMPSSA